MTQTEALRAVVEAARVVRAETIRTGEEPSLTDLFLAVEALEAAIPEKPSGFILRRSWADQEVGNWVSPDSSTLWYRVVEVGTPGDDDRVPVVVEGPDGKRYSARRKSNDPVRTRTRSEKTPTDLAIALLSATFPGTEEV